MFINIRDFSPKFRKQFLPNWEPSLRIVKKLFCGNIIFFTVILWILWVMTLARRP